MSRNSRSSRFPRACLFAAWFAASVALPAAADTYPRQLGVDVVHYVFALTLSDQSQEISGATTVTLRATADGLNQVFLDLASTDGERGMHVTAVTAGGAPAEYEHADDRIKITLPTPAAAGEERKVSVQYRGVPGGGLRLLDNVYGEWCAFSENFPNRAHQWLATVDHPYDKATGEFVVTAPARFQVVANGLLVEETDLADDLRRTRWKQSVPICTWLYALGVARFSVAHFPVGDDGTGREIPLQAWVFPQNSESGHRYFDAGRGALAFFVERVGPYSYEKLAHVQAAGLGGATEHATAIFYGSVPGAPRGRGGRGRGRRGAGEGPDAARGAAAAGEARGDAGAASGEGRRGRGDGGARRGGDAPDGLPAGVVVHETAHQWFGNAVTESDWDDVWLSEGFATYFTNLFFEHHAGREDFVRRMQGDKRTVLNAEAQSPDQPVVHRNIDLNRGRVLNRFVYQKGGWFLHMLRAQVGDEAFWKGIRAYYAKYRDKNASTADFMAEMEAASGQQLDWLFEQWLTRGGSPTLAGDWSYDPQAKQIKIALRQTQVAQPFRLPLEVGVTASQPAAGNGNAMTVHKIELAGREGEFQLPSESAPETVTLDPNVWVLMAEPQFAKKTE